MQGSDRDEVKVRQIEARRKVAVVAADLVKRFLAVADQVHFVDRDDDVSNPQEGDDKAMAFGLGENTVAGIDQDHGQVGGRSSGGHIASVLLMARSVGDDELAFGCREISIGYIDRDALFAFSSQTIGNESGVKTTSRCSMDLAFVFKLGNLVFVEHLAVIQQATDQGTFSVVDASTGDEAEQFFAFVLLEVGQDILGDQITLVRHVV